MRMVAKVHFPDAKPGELVSMEGLTYRVSTEQGAHWVLLYTPKGVAKHQYKEVARHKLTEEEINNQENKRELVAEMEFEEPED